MNDGDSDPIERANALGHSVESDAPHGLSRAERWTCPKCGLAVLRYAGNVYGSALEDTCGASS